MDGDSRAAHTGAAVALIVLGGGLSAWLVGRAVELVAADPKAPWILGRASGVTSYLLLTAVVMLGLVLSHPWRTRWNTPSSAARIRMHLSLAAFTFAFMVLHIVVLATDEYAGVGWWGALLPMASTYRPTAVTLGVIGTYAGLITGITAAFAGRWAARVWWPVHKVSGISLVLVWAHGILAGGDTTALRVLYLGTAIAVLVLALTRYTAATPADRVRDLIEHEQRHRAGHR